MLTEICQYLRNWFERKKYFGTFTIQGGVLQLDYDDGIEFSNMTLLPGQYIRIVGSVLNDGVHICPTSDLKDEVFEGAVWSMAVPPPLVLLSAEIDEWMKKYNTVDSAMLSPYQSESYGGYSYTKASGSSASGTSSGYGWENVFASRLAPWRKI